MSQTKRKKRSVEAPDVVFKQREKEKEKEKETEKEKGYVRSVLQVRATSACLVVVLTAASSVLFPSAFNLALIWLPKYCPPDSTARYCSMWWVARMMTSPVASSSRTSRYSMVLGDGSSIGAPPDSAA